MADENPPIQSLTDDSTIDPLLDLANYLDAVTFFSLLQDQGSLPTAKQAQIMKSKPKSKVPKRVKFGDKLFQGLYDHHTECESKRFRERMAFYGIIMQRKSVLFRSKVALDVKRCHVTYYSA